MKCVLLVTKGISSICDYISLEKRKYLFLIVCCPFKYLFVSTGIQVTYYNFLNILSHNAPLCSTMLHYAPLWSAMLRYAPQCPVVLH